MTVTTNLDEAIGDYSTDASTQFITARGTLNHVPPPTGDALKTAREEYNGAFAQLVSTGRLQGEQTDRAGLAAVVQLMEATAKATETICTKLLDLAHADPQDATAPSSDELDLITTLTEVLQALAQLSPAAVWTKDGRSQGS